MNAADYNPDEDRKRDDQRRVERGEVVEVVEAPKVETIVVGEEEEDEDEEEVDDDDDDEDDMFSIGVPKATKGKKTKRTKTMPVVRPFLLPLNSLTHSLPPLTANRSCA